MPENGSINDTTSTGTGTGSAPALSQAAQDYGQKISEVANQAKDYVTDKVSVVGDKIKTCRMLILVSWPKTLRNMRAKIPGRRF